MGALNPDPFVGRTIGHYDVVARVGGGAMGVVYQARDTKLGRLVALKFLPQQWSHDGNAKQRFVREAQAASATHHPNICTIHDIATAADGQLFIVMAFYEGPTLKQRLESGPVALEDALEIATQIADGLAKAHAQGVVHRDIKPGNVILTEDGVRILDFGLATFVDALKLTAENATFGTPVYMSPEQVRGQTTDARSDVWAVGVVLYEMLSGRVPFQGAYAEAIAHAIRHEAPEALRSIRPEIPEEIEQLVFRALHKDTVIRFQSGRDLSRALRHARGMTLPVTEPVAAPSPLPRPSRTSPGRRLRVRAIAVLLVAIASALTWSLWPVDRVLAAVVPIMNQTGYAELDPYRFALTEDLESRLADRAAVRVVPHDVLLQAVRRFRLEGRDVSSREALQAIAAHSGARVLIVPTVRRENGGWIVRVEFRDPGTGANRGTYETAPVVSSLMKEAVSGLVARAAEGVEEHFLANGPVRGRVRALARNAFTSESGTRRPRFATLDAAAAFEAGLSAYEQLEHAAARSAFDAAAARDSRNPLPLAWSSRVARLMRQDQVAVDVAQRALQLVTDDIDATDRLFIEAVAAEARRDPATAEQRYRELIAWHREEPRWLIEFAAFQDRQGMSLEAVTTYHEALRLNEGLVRPRLELCRLYSPSRLNEPTLARQHGDRALAVYQALGDRGGEAQAQWCLSDVLVVGSQPSQAEARRRAEAALATMKALGYEFGLARGYNSLAYVAYNERRASEAATLWKQALDASRDVGFLLLESRTLMNLGVASEALGERGLAVDYYSQAFRLFEMLGSEVDAARTQTNLAAILIDNGDPDAGLPMARDAIVVLEKLDKNFEVLARRALAMYFRHVGRRDEATRELTRALDIARERNLEGRVTQMTLESARLRFDANDYPVALELLTRVEPQASGLDRVHLRSELARTRARLGEFDAARADVSRAAMEIKEIGDVGSLPLLYLAGGEVEYEAGRLAEARMQLERASALWTGDLPEAASVEARAYAGFITATRGQVAEGRSALEASLAQARRMRRVALQALCHLLLARTDIRLGRYDEALRRLDPLMPDQESTLAPELQAQVHYWRSRALAARGDVQGAAAENLNAQRQIAALRALVSESQWMRVRSRPDIRLVTQGSDRTRSSD